ncbi:MAG: hypothetical protein QF921_13985 [Pseudomonadales bacterium]|jgi:phosphomevalonate kinase|nr:hypothetical protein [Pseudomonadales bacterium]MDP6470147.1 hypothetical protein [Pseudomonadales bacterium]MDP6827053.1 hypothetical protein [Pseudomonadales bacterium]MDP6972590.1 hypothetical protein [Pseudomonadales bacterium]|tara:strand:- start:1308 stop:2255 length:948 start_codon:yes stop_codon:yes gene_type:complete
MITASAPGKVVLWGEYAVLAGAPALVMAVNRLATCTLVHREDVWRFETEGFASVSTTRTLSELLADQAQPEAAAVASCILRTRADLSWPDAVDVRISTTEFHTGGHKLGLGSSSATTVAVQAACAALLGRPPDYAHARAAHALLQGGRGSGMDVAAAHFGGLVRFHSGEARQASLDLPPHLFIWTGEAASTIDHLSRFASYRASGNTAALEALGEAAAALFDNPSLKALSEYAAGLQRLDADSHLGIYSKAHFRLASLASDHHLVYKPCGAGGGDLGVAFAYRPDALAAFANQVNRAGFTVMQLELADYGVQVST